MINNPVYSRNKVVDVIVCSKCKCTWFYMTTVNRFSPTPTNPLIPPSSIHPNGFNALVCASCNTLFIPPSEGFMTASSVYKLHDEMEQEIAACKKQEKEELRTHFGEKTTTDVWSHLPDKSRR